MSQTPLTNEPGAGGQRAPSGPRTAALLQRVEQLEQAVERGGQAIGPDTVARVREILDGVRERLALGVDHTIVALMGGTGSGKSSLFNTIAGLQFAEVGVQRPTTAEVTACVWAQDVDALLDWLRVPTDRRIERESALDADTQADLRGLVLLDMPDFDSIEPAHRALVDQLLPMADLLVWVVDPQKYADDSLHTGYLGRLAGHEGSMLVLLNQIDIVPPATHVTLLRDATRLLREDGLVGVDVHAVSARTGAGMPVVRGVLARAVARRGLAETRAKAEVDDAARALAPVVGSGEPGVGEAAVAALAAFADAAGVQAAVTAVRRAVRGREPTDVRLGPVQADRVEAARRAWLGRVAAGLPTLWQEAVAREVPLGRDLAGAADDQLSLVPVSTRPARSVVVLRVLAAFVALAALVGVGVTLGTLAGVGWTRAAFAPAAAAAGAVVLSGALLLATGAARYLTAHRRAAAVAAGARKALAELVDTMLVQPTVAVLEDHRAVRELLAAAAPPPGSVRPTIVAPLPAAGGPGPGRPEPPTAAEPTGSSTA